MSAQENINPDNQNSNNNELPTERARRGRRGERSLRDVSERRRGPRDDRPRDGRNRRGRRGRGDLRTAVLVLLAEQPRHGYELMQEIAERTNGSWQPSPGSIYPTLQVLQDEGLVRIVHDESNRSVAHLTDDGVKYTATIGDGAASVWEHAAGRDSSAHKQLWLANNDLVRALKQVSQVGTADQVEQAVGVVNATQRSLYGILAQDPEAR